MRATDGVSWFGPMIGGCILAMVALTLWQRRSGNPLPQHPLIAGATGASAGFVSTVSNSAGPIMALYFQAIGFDRKTFVGTAAVFFLCLNLIKVPFLWEADVIQPSALLLALSTVPIVIIGALYGKWLLNKLSDHFFQWIITGLIIASAVRLLFI